ncbi:unnamed protein product, partial [Urochloa humidicola]
PAAPGGRGGLHLRRGADVAGAARRRGGGAGRPPAWRRGAAPDLGSSARDPKEVPPPRDPVEVSWPSASVDEIVERVDAASIHPDGGMAAAAAQVMVDGFSCSSASRTISFPGPVTTPPLLISQPPHLGSLLSHRSWRASSGECRGLAAGDGSPPSWSCSLRGASATARCAATGANDAGILGAALESAPCRRRRRRRRAVPNTRPGGSSSRQRRRRPRSTASSTPSV